MPTTVVELVREGDSALPTALPVPGSAARTARARAWMPPALIGLFAFTISVVGSWIPNLWGDEAASLLSATRSLPSLWTMINHVDAVHAGYYAFLHVWIEFFGDSPFSIRFPSAIAAGIAAAGVVVLVRRFAPTALAVVAGLACAVLPRMTYAGEEARSYAMTAAIAVWLTIVLVSALNRARRGDRIWVVYGVLLSLGIQLFLYLALIAVVHAISLAALRAPRVVWRAWRRTVLVAGAVALPFMVLAVSEHSQISFLANRNDSSLGVVLPGAFFTSVPLAVVGWALCLLATVAFAARRIRRTPWTPIDTLTVLVLPWAFGPFIILESLNLAIPSFTGRYLTMSAPAVAVVIVLGVRDLVLFVRRTVERRGGDGRRMLRPTVVATVAGAAAVVTLVGLTVPVWIDQRTPYAKNNSDWSQISETIGAAARHGDAIVFDEGARPSRRPRLAMRAYPAGFANVRDVSLAKPYYDVADWSDETLPIAEVIRQGRLADVSRVWVVEYATGTTVDDYGIAALEGIGFVRVAAVREHSSEIYLYEREAAPSAAPLTRVAGAPALNDDVVFVS